MKRIPVLLALVTLASFSLPAIADKSHSHMTGAKESTLTGEVVDTGCYLAHAARGEKHVSCANKCIAQGMPMGLLTKDQSLYLITLNHDNADPYTQLQKMAGQTVTLTGTVMTRGGMKGIDVTGVKAVAAAAK